MRYRSGMIGGCFFEVGKLLSKLWLLLVINFIMITSAASTLFHLFISFKKLVAIYFKIGKLVSLG
jgi:hypothetical protein